MPDVYHALGLHLHRPPGNLAALHDQPDLAEFTLPPLSIVAFKPERVEVAPAAQEAKLAEEMT